MKDAKERFDAYVKLAEFWVSRHDARREYEWKVSLGVWGVLVAAIHYSADAKRIFPSSLCVLTLTLIIAFLFFWLTWLFPLWKRNHSDKEKGFHYVYEGQQILSDPNHIAALPDLTKIKADSAFGGFVWDWSMFFQAVTTIALLIVLGRVIAKN